MKMSLNARGHREAPRIQRNHFIILLFSFFFAACGNTGAPLAAGKTAPDFRLGDLTGRTVFLNAELKRPVVLTFFATWCVPCREEVPLLIDLARKYDDKIQVLCVVADPENLDKVRSLAAGLNIPYPMLLEEKGRTMGAYGVKELPATFLIRTDGRIVSRYGAFDETQSRMLSQEIDRLIGAKHE